MLKSKQSFLLLLTLMLAIADGTTAQHGSHAQATNAEPSTSTEVEQAAKEVATIHGGAGPFAVAGYRMGRRALRQFGLSKGSFAVGVVHQAPAQVQWSCVVDGLQAATGTSLGKLNLRLESASQQAMRSVVEDRQSGKRMVFRLHKSFVERFLNLPTEDLQKDGLEVLGLADDNIFTLETNNRTAGKRSTTTRRRKGRRATMR